MKKTIFSLLLLTSILTGNAQNINEGVWQLTFDDKSKTLTIANGGKNIVSSVYATANCAPSAATELTTLRSCDAATVSHTLQDVIDDFGNGHEHKFTYTFDNGMKMMQTLSFYDGVDYLVVRLMVKAPDGQQVKSNRLSPLVSTTTTTVMPDNKQNRMLFVPWDNDGFSKYESKYLRSDLYSYATTAVFNVETRYGIVAGAVDHDTWKSVVHVNASDYRKINEFALISGYTDENTRDTIQATGAIIPHGTVVADTAKSARFIMGCFADWRDGMETFGKACTKVAPRRTWAGGTPYGWSSWGVMQTKVSYEGIIDVADFIRDNLVGHGFHDEKGRIVMSLDAWWNDNLTNEQVKRFVAYCEANNMIPGLYYGPFCLFADINNIVPGTNGRYKFSDIAMKQNGRYKKIDGAYCLDPTHKGTKLFILNDINKFKSLGIKYLKCDFMSHGAIEADSWADTNCHTGIQAYNKGMAYLTKLTGDDIYIDLSISPAFPYQYAHGRRISCDAWASIDNTRYVMSNTSYGWWLNQVYFANDPDHLVLKSLGDGGRESLGTNRARITSGAVTGAFLCGDNFSDNVDAGYPEKSRERALDLLTNADVNEIARTCGTFRPIEGGNSTGLGAENLLTYDNGKYVYVAGINYATLLPLSGTMKFSRCGIDASHIAEIKELWTGKTIDHDNDGFSYTIPASDARIYRITKKEEGSGIASTQHDTSSAIAIEAGHGFVSAECHASKITSLNIYDMAGALIQSSSPYTHTAKTPLPQTGKGPYMIKAVTLDGSSQTMKINR